MYFSLIDKIDTLEPGKRIAATKSLSLAEEYLRDHFPNFPVMPGVLMLEALTKHRLGSFGSAKILHIASWC